MKILLLFSLIATAATVFAAAPGFTAKEIAEYVTNITADANFFQDLDQCKFEFTNLPSLIGKQANGRELCSYMKSKCLLQLANENSTTPKFSESAKACIELMEPAEFTTLDATVIGRMTDSEKLMADFTGILTLPTGMFQHVKWHKFKDEFFVNNAVALSNLDYDTLNSVTNTFFRERLHFTINDTTITTGWTDSRKWGSFIWDLNNLTPSVLPKISYDCFKALEEDVRMNMSLATANRLSKDIFRAIDMNTARTISSKVWDDLDNSLVIEIPKIGDKKNMNHPCTAMMALTSKPKRDKYKNICGKTEAVRDL